MVRINPKDKVKILVKWAKAGCLDDKAEIPDDWNTNPTYSIHLVNMVKNSLLPDLPLQYRVMEIIGNDNRGQGYDPPEDLFE